MKDLPIIFMSPLRAYQQKKRVSTNLAAPMMQWLVYAATNIQVVGLNTAHTCICEICFLVGDAPRPYNTSVTRAEAKQPNSTVDKSEFN